MGDPGSNLAGSYGFYALGERFPGRVAMVDPRERQVTYGEMAGRAHQMARGLRGLGLQPGDTLAVVLTNCRELIELYAAAMEIGLFFVAVNWHLGHGEIAYLLEDSRTRAIVTEPSFADGVATAADLAGIPARARFTIGEVRGFRLLEQLAEGQSAEPPDDRRPGLALFYTSGTTGRPKGVRKRVRQARADEVTLSIGIGLTRPPTPDSEAHGPDPPVDNVQIVCGPLYHAAPIAAAAMVLDRGGLLVLMGKWTPEHFLGLVERYRVTDAAMVPTMFHRLLALPSTVRDRADVSSLRSVTHAGAPCPIEVKRRMLDWWGPVITETYSSTEGAGTSVTAEEWLQRPGTVGQPSPGVTISILDEEGAECPANVPGLVYMTPTLWEFEYQNDPDKTEASRRSGMFTVGDIGYLDDAGYLFLCDRQSEIIVSGGVNIYPAEVESVLLAHPAVADAAVVGAPNDEWGEEVRGVVELRSGALGSEQLGRELVDFCRERIAHYKCPGRIDFVESLGRDPNGKLRRRPIRDRYWEGRSRKI